MSQEIPPAQPLAGVRVLEFGQAVSSPMCTMLLGDLGADVVKIEPPHGDAARGYGPPFVAGESPYFLSVNRNKRSAVINLKHPEGSAIVRRLAEEADIIVTNFRPGVMDRLGLGEESLRTVNPGLIFCQVSGYGPRGKYATQASYDQVAQGMSGLMSVTGTPESGPVRVGVAIGDVLASMFAAYGVLGAFVSRQQTGLGQRVDTSLLGAIIGILTFQTGGYLASGDDPSLIGNNHPVASPYSAFKTSDGMINIAVASEPVWQRLADTLGHPEWVDDARFKTNADRVSNRPAINALVTEALASVHDGRMGRAAERSGHRLRANLVDRPVAAERCRRRTRYHPTGAARFGGQHPADWAGHRDVADPANHPPSTAATRPAHERDPCRTRV